MSSDIAGKWRKAPACQRVLVGATGSGGRSSGGAVDEQAAHVMVNAIRANRRHVDLMARDPVQHGPYEDPCPASGCAESSGVSCEHETWVWRSSMAPWAITEVSVHAITRPISTESLRAHTLTFVCGRAGSPVVRSTPSLQAEARRQTAHRLPGVSRRASRADATPGRLCEPVGNVRVSRHPRPVVRLPAETLAGAVSGRGATRCELPQHRVSGARLRRPDGLL